MPKGEYRGGDSKDSHKRYIKRALEQGSCDWPPHTYRMVEGRLGRLLLYYIQGMLMSVWRIDSGEIWHMPIVYGQDNYTYNRHQAKFEQSVKAVEGEGKA